MKTRTSKYLDRDLQERDYWNWMVRQTLAMRRQARQREVFSRIQAGRSAAKRRAAR